MKEIDYSRNNKWLSIVFFILLFLFIQIFDLINWERESFIVKNLFLLIFLYYNIKKNREENSHKWLLNPAVLASLMTFLLGYCITNYIYFIPGSQSEILVFKLLGSEPLMYLNRGMNAVIISAIAMWIGYNTALGIKLYKLILRFPINFRKYLRSSFTPNLKIIYWIIGLAYTARMYAIYMGVYGYSQTAETREAASGFSNILISISDLASFSLIIVAFVYFKNQKNNKYKFIFFTLLIVEVGFGILSGMKAAVVMPLVLSFVIYYLVNNKLHKGFIVAVIIFITIAYLIIEPFRILKSLDPDFKSTPSNIVNTMVDAYFLNKRVKLVTDTENIFESIVSRNAYLLAASKSMQYADKPGLSNDDPDFLEKIYTIPFQAFVPRFIWSSKPVEDQSSWYSVYVWGSTPTNSVAMTPMGFLYFAGGYLFLILGFFLIGILQKNFVAILSWRWRSIISFSCSLKHSSSYR